MVYIHETNILASTVSTVVGIYHTALVTVTHTLSVCNNSDCTCTHACTHVCIHINACMHTRICVNKHVHTHKHTYIYTREVYINNKCTYIYT